MPDSPDKSAQPKILNPGKVNLRFACDPEGVRLIQRGGDTSARLLLIDLAMIEYDAENYEGTSALLHAMFYLEDRVAYELCPPPYRMALPASFTMGRGYAWQAEQMLGGVK